MGVDFHGQVSVMLGVSDGGWEGGVGEGNFVVTVV